ncbi:hypothetical protein CUC53_12680 [Aeromonas cavernicola]|uniref:Uncharacterized protein n=2 Tax=Aeromonas cavernicola TaxID=1006623 RepID=A0A2H9U2Z6_9GAMM|nr:hypothetical protein CUC53_12680 [Aeromonas cavernicola]
MVENPGPLASINGNPASNFASCKYNKTILDEDLILYRAGKSGGGKNGFGQWFTREPISSEAQARLDLAVKPQWKDANGVLTGESPIESVYAVRIPKGTEVYEGPVGYQGGAYLGGQDIMQIYVHQPWALRGAQVIKEVPIAKR